MSFIAGNSHNEGLSITDREKLLDLRRNIDKTNKKMKVVRMIDSPNPNIQAIKATTGLSEGEIIAILNKVYVTVEVVKEPKGSHDEVEGY